MPERASVKFADGALFRGSAAAILPAGRATLALMTRALPARRHISSSRDSAIHHRKCDTDRLAPAIFGPDGRVDLAA